MQARTGQSPDEEDDDPVELKIEAPVYRSNFQARRLKKSTRVKKKSNVTSQRRKENKQISTKAQNNNSNVEESPLPNQKLETGQTSDEDQDSSERDLFLEDTIEMLQSYSDSPFFLDTQQAEEYSIDSFLRGDYDRPFAEDAPGSYYDIFHCSMIFM